MRMGGTNTGGGWSTGMGIGALENDRGRGPTGWCARAQGGGIEQRAQMPREPVQCADIQLIVNPARVGGVTPVAHEARATQHAKVMRDEVLGVAQQTRQLADAGLALAQQ